MTDQLHVYKRRKARQDFTKFKTLIDTPADLTLGLQLPANCVLFASTSAVTAAPTALVDVNVPSQSAEPQLRFASVYNVAPSDNSTFTATRTHALFRMPFKIGSADMSDLVLSFINWRLGQNVNGIPNSYNIVECSLELDDPSAFVPVTFDGLRTAVVPAGATDFNSDPVPASAFELDSFEVGTTGWIRCHLTVNDGTTDVVPSKYYGGAISGSTRWKYDPSGFTVTNGVDGVGAMDGTGDELEGISIWSPWVLGHPVTGNCLSVLGIGDSIVEATGDTEAFGGFIGRALGAVSGVSPIAGISMGCSGSTTSIWFDFTPSGTEINPLYTAYFKYANVLIEAYGTNGLNEDQNLLIWAAARAAGISTIIRTSLWPRVDSSDEFLTLENQTINDNWGPDNFADLTEDWLKTKIGTPDGFDYYIEWGTPPRALADYWKWAVDGVTPYYMTDGLHPSAVGHQETAYGTASVTDTVGTTSSNLAALIRSVELSGLSSDHRELSVPASAANAIRRFDGIRGGRTVTKSSGAPGTVSVYVADGFGVPHLIAQG